MPQAVGPDGQLHSFPEGTPPEVMTEQLSKIYGVQGTLTHGSALPEAGDPTAAAGAVMPGMQVTPDYNTDEDWANIGLTAAMSPRSLGMALMNTPGHAARVAQAKDTAHNLAALGEKQRAGGQILDGLNMVRHTVNMADDATLSNAIGPTVSAPWLQGARRTIAGLVPGPVTPYDQSYNLNNLLHHDIHGLVQQFIAAGKAANMSDSRQAAFEATMADMLRATNRDDLNKVADHAEFIIKSSFGLPHKKPGEVGAGAGANGASAGRVYQNAQGQKIQWDGQQWQPVQ